MVCAIGDLHISDDRPWSFEVSKKMVNYIINHPFNNSENILVFLGDVTDKAFLSGPVISLVEHLFKSLVCKHIYVIKGNHEITLNKAGKETYVLDFLRSSVFHNVTLVEEQMVFEDGEDSYLLLPWIRQTHTRNMKKEYEALQFPPEQRPFTAVFGHLQEASLNLPGESIDLSHIPTKHFCLGHIHNPSERCIGSVIPNSVSEAQKTRSFRSYEKGEMEITPIQSLLDYYEVEYPEPLPIVDCDIPVFTIYNCADKTVAKEKYGDIYIRDCKYKISLNLSKESDNKEGMDSLRNMKPLDLFQAFKKITTFNPSEIGDIAEQYLMITN